MVSTHFKASVLLMTYVWPEPRSSAAGLRDRQLIGTFLRAGWSVSCASPSKSNEYQEELKQLGVPTYAVQANDPAFDEFIARLKPDFVIFDRFVTEEQFGWRVEKHSPLSVRIVDTQDLHCLRRAREATLKTGASLADIKDCKFELQTEDALRELASIYRSDLTLVISDFEQDLLTNQFGVSRDLLMLLRLYYAEPPALPAFDQTENFVMIGNFRHPPNYDAVFWLKQEIWPRIRKLMPEAQVHLYGAYPPKEVMDLNHPSSGFIVKGWADDQYQTLSRYRVNLAPLRFGAGIKGKISDGWWCGIPAVTTPIGAEGMCEELPFGGLICQDPDEFARAAVRIYQDREEWQKYQRAGRTILRALFDETLLSKTLMDRLIQTRERLGEIRLRNLTGAMLRQHHQRSTEYFSRWIEAKNKVSSPASE